MDEAFFNSSSSSSDDDDDDDDSQTSTGEDDNDDDVFKIHEGEILDGKMSGSHIFSRYFKLRAIEKNFFNGDLAVDMDVQFTVPSGFEGDYFVIASAVYFIASSTDPSRIKTRMEMAAAVPTKTIHFQAPPEWLVITNKFKIGLISVVCFALLWEAYLLSFMWKHRKHPIMQISQGNFLILLVVCCMFGTAGVLFFLPIRDLFCNLRSPISSFTLQMIGAILVGRLWRVYSMLSVPLGIDKKHGSVSIIAVLDFLSNWENFVPTKRCRTYVERNNRRSRLRKVVTNGQTTCLILALTFPQVIIHICKGLLCRQFVDFQYNEDSSTIKQQCNPSCIQYQIIMLVPNLVVYLLAVVMAWLSSELPSVFNEREAIFNASWINLFVIITGIALMVSTRDPTTLPDVLVGLYAGMVLAIVLTTCRLLLVPKIKRVKSGEKVVVSKLLADRRTSSRHELFYEKHHGSSFDMMRGAMVDFTAMSANLAFHNGGLEEDTANGTTSTVENPPLIGVHEDDDDDDEEEPEVGALIPPEAAAAATTATGLPYHHHHHSPMYAENDQDDESVVWREMAPPPAPSPLPSLTGSMYSVVSMPPSILTQQTNTFPKANVHFSTSSSPPPSSSSEIPPPPPPRTFPIQQSQSDEWEIPPPTAPPQRAASVPYSEASSIISKATSVPYSEASSSLISKTAPPSRLSSGEVGTLSVAVSTSTTVPLAQQRPAVISRNKSCDYPSPRPSRQARKRHPNQQQQQQQHRRSDQHMRASLNSTVIMKSFQPPPRRFEEQLLLMRTLIGDVATRSLEGRAMDKKEWESLKKHTNTLNVMMGRIVYQWDKDGGGGGGESES